MSPLTQGQLTRVVSTADKYTIQKDFSYDIQGRRLSESKKVSHSTDTLCSSAADLPCQSLTSWAYDNLGGLVSTTHPDGTTIMNEYIGGTSLLRKIKTSSTDYVTYSDYTINAQPSSMVYSNGVSTRYKYSSNTYLRRLKVEMTEPADPNTPGSSPRKRSLLHYRYSFDLLGNVKFTEDRVRYSPNVRIPRRLDYHYDNLNRLTSVDQRIQREESRDYFSYSFKKNHLVDINEGLKKRLCYNADCTSDSSNGTSKPHHERVLNASDSYVQNSDTYTFVWSAGGNLLSKSNTTNGATTYTYDAQNMLRTLTASGGKKTSHYYDESGQRFLKAYKETTSSPEIRTYYLSPSFELREKWSGGSKTAFQSTLYIAGADGQRAVSKTTGSYLLAQMRSNQNYRLAGMYNNASLEGLLFKAKHIMLGVYYETSFARVLYLSFVLLSIFLVLCLAVYYHKYSEFSLLNSVTSAFMVLMVISAFSCGSQTYVSVDEGDPKYGYSLMGDTSGGLPMGTYYYHGNHLGSASLVTNSSGREVMRISYTPYGAIEQGYSGRIGCSMGTVDTSYEDCTGGWTKLYDVTEGANAGVTHKFTGQEYDPENSLYYYNARYYDPSIGIFTTADTIIPDESDPLSYNRHMYVRGNPINYTDPSGHCFIICLISLGIAAVFAVTAVSAGVESLVTGESFVSTFKKHINGVTAAVGSLILAPVALNPLLTGIISELSGGSFEEGFAAGLGNLGLAIGTFGGSIVVSAVNAYAAGYYGIYGRNERGNNDYFLDHTVAQGTTAIGTVAALTHLAEGGKFEKELSRGTGSFMYSNTSFSRSNSVGNVIGLSKEDSALLGTAKGKRVLRHELVHSRQYRRGGLFNLARLGLEYFGAYGSDPYNRPGTLENEAKTIADNGLRPWYFKNLDDRFF